MRLTSKSAPVHVQNSLQVHDTFWGFSNNSSSRDWSIIDHLHNGFKYSFTCILKSILCLIQVQWFYSITDTETWPRRLIKMHIKEYLNRSPLCKWSITGRIFFSANDDRALERRHHMVHLNPILFGAFQFDRWRGKVRRPLSTLFISWAMTA